MFCASSDILTNSVIITGVQALDFWTSGPGPGPGLGPGLGPGVVVVVVSEAVVVVEVAG